MCVCVILSSTLTVGFASGVSFWRRIFVEVLRISVVPLVAASVVVVTVLSTLPLRATPKHVWAVGGQRCTVSVARRRS